MVLPIPTFRAGSRTPISGRQGGRILVLLIKAATRGILPCVLFCAARWTLAQPPEVPKAEEKIQATADVVPTPEGQFVIDLGTALHLAESQNPQMALARERITEAIAQHNEARALWMPTLAAGANYHLHTGVLQTSFGQMRRLNEQSIYVGGGARTLAAESVAIPAVRIFGHLGDMYYLPLAARQVVTVRSFQSRTVNNLTLLDVSDRYLALLEAEARREAFQASLRELGEIARAQNVFAKAGQGREADYRRARSEFLLMMIEEQRAQEDAAVAAAELSRLLHLDPAIRLVTAAGPIELIELVDETQPTESLVMTALQQRPEIAARGAEIGAAEFRLRDEQMRPWLPLISVGFSGGAFGGGSNRQDLGVPSTFMTMAGRTDFDLWAFWTVQNLGAGNKAWQGMRCAEMEEAVMQRALTMAQVRRDVTSRRAESQARRREVDVSWIQLAAGERGATEELNRTRAGEALPIEAINNVTRLAESRRQLIKAVVEYNRAELRLFVAMGQVPGETATVVVNSPGME